MYDGEFNSLSDYVLDSLVNKKRKSKCKYLMTRQDLIEQLIYACKLEEKYGYDGASSLKSRINAVAFTELREAGKKLFEVPGCFCGMGNGDGNFKQCDGLIANCEIAIKMDALHEEYKQKRKRDPNYGMPTDSKIW